MGYVGLRPVDLADITPYQMDSALEVAKTIVGVK